MSVILGIDPGSRITGFGVIDVKQGQQPNFIACGCIRTSTGYLGNKLSQIFSDLQQVIETYQPDEVAVEEVFMHVNPNSALKLGHARGVAMLAASLKQLPISEYSARKIKKSIVGYGGAEKNQIQHMVRTILGLSKAPQADAADALAIALCHNFNRMSSTLKYAVSA